MVVKLIPHKPDKIIGIEIDGWIDRSDLDRIIEHIEQKLAQEDKLRIYAEVNNWSGMSLSAFIRDLNFSLKHFNDFEKEAIVSDQQWLEIVAALGNTLFSGIEVRHFTLNEKDQALEWLVS